MPVLGAGVMVAAVGRILSFAESDTINCNGTNHTNNTKKNNIRTGANHWYVKYWNHRKCCTNSNTDSSDQHEMLDYIPKLITIFKDINGITGKSVKWL